MEQQEEVKTTVRPRTFEEMDKMAAEASWVGTAYVVRSTLGKRHAVPLAVVYGESEAEVRDRLKWRLDEKQFKLGG